MVSIKTGNLLRQTLYMNYFIPVETIKLLSIPTLEFDGTYPFYVNIPTHVKKTRTWRGFKYICNYERIPNKFLRVTCTKRNYLDLLDVMELKPQYKILVNNQHTHLIVLNKCDGYMVLTLKVELISEDNFPRLFNELRKCHIELERYNSNLEQRIADLERQIADSEQVQQDQFKNKENIENI
jgi:phage regulator Rha-like protein